VRPSVYLSVSPFLLSPHLTNQKNHQTTEPAPQSICVITGSPARYRDPNTGLPFYNASAYHHIQCLIRGEYRWSALLGAWVGGKHPPAQGVPERFTNPDAPRSTTPASAGTKTAAVDVSGPAVAATTNATPVTTIAAASPVTGAGGSPAAVEGSKPGDGISPAPATAAAQNSSNAQENATTTARFQPSPDAAPITSQPPAAAATTTAAAVTATAPTTTTTTTTTTAVNNEGSKSASVSTVNT
jgi:vacuolar protein sorting-associated protein 72